MYVLTGRLGGTLCERCEPQPLAGARLALTDTTTGAALGRTVAGDAGRFSLGLPPGYSGGPVTVHATVARVAGLDPVSGRRPVTFEVATVQPAWQAGEAHWEHRVAAALWHATLDQLGVRTICGELTADGRPVTGAVVAAFDADLVDDDPLGAALTDPHGRFRIVYRTSDFDRGEAGGADVYFRARLGTATLLDEPSSARRPAGVGLCVALVAPARVSDAA